jgi:predicted deacylase
MASLSTLLHFNPEIFPGSYQQACLRWQQALALVPLAIKRRDFTVPNTEFSCQTAWLGEPDAANVLVLIGGTHGVEGFAGSAVQIDLFNLLAKNVLDLPANTAVLAIHALNPWGYAHCRRCDGEGIDVNRNFVDFSAPLPANPGYQQLQPLFRLHNSGERAQALAQMAARMGQREYEIAFSGGQYCDPQGPFYGGTAPGFSNNVITTLIADYALATRHLAVVDIHTGLGPYGYGEVICDHDPGSSGAATAFAWFGQGCTLPAAGTSSSVPKLGLLDYAWHRLMAGRGAFVTLEFGTLGTDSLFDVLLAEAACWAANNSGCRKAVADKMRAHFNPNDDAWREAVIFRARQVLSQSLAGIAKQP